MHAGTQQELFFKLEKIIKLLESIENKLTKRITPISQALIKDIITFTKIQGEGNGRTKENDSNG